LRESGKVTAGAGRIKVLTLVTEAARLDRTIHLREITPLYLPLLSKTAKTGGNSSLKRDRQEESVSFSCTFKKPFEKTSLTLLTTENTSILIILVA
jgi:hypothetical protein